MTLQAPLRLVKSVPLTLTRTSLGTYVNGKPVAGATTEVVITANVQPISKSTMTDMLSEGERQKACLEIYSKQEIRMVREGENGYPADRFVWNGEEYEVMKSVRWSMSILDHWHAVAKRVENQ